MKALVRGILPGLIQVKEKIKIKEISSQGESFSERNFAWTCSGKRRKLK